MLHFHERFKESLTRRIDKCQSPCYIDFARSHLFPCRNTKNIAFPPPSPISEYQPLNPDPPPLQPLARNVFLDRLLCLLDTTTPPGVMLTQLGTLYAGTRKQSL